MLGRHLSGVAIADTSDFGPKPWISIAAVIWRMRPILVHLSWGYRAEIDPMHVKPVFLKLLENCLKINNFQKLLKKLL